MIGYIEGTVIHSENNKALVLTSIGIGYEVSTTKTYFPDQKVALFTAQIFREDNQLLFGFETIDDKRLFELLIEVNGVGPKTAFNIIAHLGAEVVVRSILLEDAITLKKVPGLGKKGADQMILTLKDKMQKWSISMNSQTHAAINLDRSQNIDVDLFHEALEACQGLGFKEHLVAPLIKRLLSENTFKDSEQLMMSILKEMR